MTALIAAVAALGGVIIGGLITAGTTAYFERRREQADLRQVRRLVLEELRTIGSHAADLGKMRSYPPKAPPDTGEFLPTRQWEASRPALARYLDDETWDALSSFMESVRSARALVRVGVLEPIPAEQIERFKRTRDGAVDIYFSMTGGQSIRGADFELEDEEKDEAGE